MLLVKTYVDHSSIHGLGVFAGEPIKKGTQLWQFHHGLDGTVDVNYLEGFPVVMQKVIKKYGYRVDEETIVYCCDDTKYMNHSKEDPNVISTSVSSDVAARDIDFGEELTIDYGTFDLDWRQKIDRRTADD